MTLSFEKKSVFYYKKYMECIRQEHQNSYWKVMDELKQINIELIVNSFYPFNLKQLDIVSSGKIVIILDNYFSLKDEMFNIINNIYRCKNIIVIYNKMKIVCNGNSIEITIHDDESIDNIKLLLIPYMNGNKNYYIYKNNTRITTSIQKLTPESRRLYKAYKAFRRHPLYYDYYNDSWNARKHCIIAQYL